MTEKQLKRAFDELLPSEELQQRVKLAVQQPKQVTKKRWIAPVVSAACLMLVIGFAANRSLWSTTQSAHNVTMDTTVATEDTGGIMDHNEEVAENQILPNETADAPMTGTSIYGQVVEIQLDFITIGLEDGTRKTLSLPLEWQMVVQQELQLEDDVKVWYDEETLTVLDITLV